MSPAIQLWISALFRWYPEQRSLTGKILLSHATVKAVFPWVHVVMPCDNLSSGMHIIIAYLISL